MEIPLLTSGESKVYSSLIELGESSIGDILKTSGVSHSKVYDILKRLSEKGLISSLNKNGKQYFSAADASRLKFLIDEEKKKIEIAEKQIVEKIKQLNVRKNISKPISVLSSFEGIKGMKAVLESILDRLKKNEEVLILGSPKVVGEQAGGYLKEWQKRRIKRGALCRIISDLDSPSWNDDWWKKSKKNSITFTKRSKSVSPAYLVITKDSVTTIYFSGIVLSFKVEHKDIAMKYKEFFNTLWKSAK